MYEMPKMVPMPGIEKLAELKAEYPFSFKVGDVCVFNTHGGDSTWNERSGETCMVLRSLTPDEADMFDVGPMYRIVFSDGQLADAFEDELTRI